MVATRWQEFSEGSIILDIGFPRGRSVTSHSPKDFVDTASTWSVVRGDELRRATMWMMWLSECGCVDVGRGSRSTMMSVAVAIDISVDRRNVSTIISKQLNNEFNIYCRTLASRHPYPCTSFRDYLFSIFRWPRGINGW